MALRPSVHVTDQESPNAPSVPREVLALIDESTIARVVHEFYHRVRHDSMLGEIFDARIADWEFHLERMCEFWSSIAPGSGRYHGRPLSKHMTLPVGAPHFDRWLELFASTAQKICTPAAAELLTKRARLIARSLEGGIASAHRVVLAREERFDASRDLTLEQIGEHMKPILPAGLKAYKRTPIFDEHTLPAGLRREHRTKPGVWALIHVTHGALRYRVLDPFHEEILTEARPGVVWPRQLHEVEPVGSMQMFVEFFAEDPAGDTPHT
jgi:hemoglobin